MTSLQKGLVGHWTLDSSDTSNGTVYDSSTYDNHGTSNGTSVFSNSIIGESHEFNGDGDYISISNNIEMDSDSATLSAFLYVDDYTSHIDRADECMFVVYPGQTTCRYIGFGNGSMAMETDVNNDGGGTINSNKIVEGSWFHTAIVFDNGTLYLYIDSENVGNVSLNNNNLTFGHIGHKMGDGDYQSGYPSWFDGRMSDIRVYNRALSESEISALYNMRSQRTQTNDLAKGLVGYWTMDDADTSGGTLYDRSSRDNNGTLVNGVNTSQPAIVGEAHSLDGSTQYIDVSDSFWQDMFGSSVRYTESTVTAWVNVNDLSNLYADSTAGSILGQRYGTYNVFGIRGDGSLFVCLDDSRSASPESTGTITQGNWHHIVITHSWSDDRSTTPYGTANFYIDGEFAGTDTNDNDSAADSSSELFIGYDARENMYLNTEISNLRVYNRVISASEARTLYNNRT